MSAPNILYVVVTCPVCQQRVSATVVLTAAMIKLHASPNADTPCPGSNRTVRVPWAGVA